MRLPPGGKPASILTVHESAFASARNLLSPEGNQPLTNSQINLLRSWIDRPVRAGTIA
ncbi:MAG: hypothetical protein KDB00_13220 [Planctomycetales bacterium]|nr:hypothetical protein [Planctomycetales bacterium]